MNVLDADEDFVGNVVFPLPYHVFLLLALGLLGWATNLHGLDALEIDAVTVLNLRTEGYPPRLPVSQRVFTHTMAPTIYKSAYRVFVGYSAFCFSSWLVYRLGTRGDPTLVDSYAHVPAITAIILIFIIWCPYDICFKTERDKFVQAIRRCLFSSMNTPILFSDVVLADIGTSFAKVFGDIWLCICMLLPGNSMLFTPRNHGLLKWVLPTVMSFPYFIRFRQCVIEYTLPSNQSRRPLFNAVKYATAFPVIFLSAAQSITVIDIIKQNGDNDPSGALDEERHLFRLWLLAVFVNSLYSFWWDVSNDWGLELLRTEASVAKERYYPKQSPELPPSTPLISQNPLDSSQSHFDQSYRGINVPRSLRQGYPYGLRPTLLYPTFFYRALIVVNLVLRMTWSVKLSTHLQSARDGSIFMMCLEAAEIVRRWLWVFIRVEWEVIKKMNEGQPRPDPSSIDQLYVGTTSVELSRPPSIKSHHPLIDDET